MDRIAAELIERAAARERVDARIALPTDANIFTLLIDRTVPDWPDSNEIIGQAQITDDNDIVICSFDVHGGVLLDPLGSIIPVTGVSHELGHSYNEKDESVQQLLRAGFKLKILRDGNFSLKCAAYADYLEKEVITRHHSISIDATGGSSFYTGIGSGGTVSWTHSQGAVTDGLIVISNTNFSGNGGTFQTCTYDGGAVTSRTTRQQTGGSKNPRGTIFSNVLGTVGSGSKNVVLTCNDVANNGLVRSTSWNGADQSSTFGTPVTGGGANAGAFDSAGSAATPTDGVLLDAFGKEATVGITQSHTLIAKAETAGTNNDWAGLQYTLNAGTQNLGYTTVSGSSYRWTHVILPVNAAAGGGSNIKTIDGLAYASIKTVNGLAIASMKSRNGLT